MISVDSPFGLLTGSVCQSPYPPLVPDSQCLHDLQNHATTIAENLDRLLLEFKGTRLGHGVRRAPPRAFVATSGLQMSSLTADNVATYSRAVGHTCDSIDTAIKVRISPSGSF